MANWKLGKSQYGSVKTVTSGGTLALIASSKQFQILTGTANHTVTLPDATTTSNGNGISFTVINESTGNITVNDNGNNLLSTITSNSSADFLLTSVSVANGTWRVSSFTGTAGGGLGSTAPGSIVSSNYSMLSTDKGRVINVDCSGGAITLTLPVPTSGFIVTVKDLTGNAAINNITIARNGSELVDSYSLNSILSTAWSSLSLISDGTNWFRIAEFTGGPPNPGFGRGIFAGGGGGGSAVNTIEYINISIASNSLNFGNLTQARVIETGCGWSSTTRGIWVGGDTSGVGTAPTTTIDYVTIATLGNATSFGSLSGNRDYQGNASNSVRGICSNGSADGGTSNLQLIEYITIATTGNSINFGNDITFRRGDVGCASPTRAVFGGGFDGSSYLTVMNYVTIATTGNSTSFGNLTTPCNQGAACSNPTRGVWGGGYTGSSNLSTLQYITIATTGNATNFGNLTVARQNLGACSSSIYGVWAGGESGSLVNTIDYSNISTLGTGISFGNLLSSRLGVAGLSNSHGGL